MLAGRRHVIPDVRKTDFIVQERKQHDHCVYVVLWCCWSPKWNAEA